MNYSLLSIIIFTLVLSGCSMMPFSDRQSNAPSGLTSGSKEHDMMDHNSMNHASVTSELQFITDMIPHHQEAVNTSVIITQNSTNTGLRQLADTIIQTQTQEIGMMQSRLEEWYPTSSLVSTYQTMMPDLNALTGAARDRAYLEGMIAHHQGAIQMAQGVLALNPRPEIVNFAQAIMTVQKAEVQMMQLMLKDIK